MRWTAITLVALMLATCGCGNANISAADAVSVSEAETAFARTVLDGSDYDGTLRGIDYLIRLCRREPNARYDGRTVRQVLEDGANTLRPYQPDLSAQLDRVLDDGCK